MPERPTDLGTAIGAALERRRAAAEARPKSPLEKALREHCATIRAAHNQQQGATDGAA